MACVCVIDENAMKPPEFFAFVSVENRNKKKRFCYSSRKLPEMLVVARV